jgi:hypothetical protein
MDTILILAEKGQVTSPVRKVGVRDCTDIQTCAQGTISKV